MVRVRITRWRGTAMVLAVALASSVTGCAATTGPATTSTGAGVTESVTAERVEPSSVPPAPPSPGVEPPSRLVVPDNADPSAAVSPVPDEERPLTPEELAAGVRAAAAWVSAWARPPVGTRHDVWKTRVAAVTMPEQVVLLDDIDPQNIPYTTVTGPPVVVASGAGFVDADVPTDNYPIRVTVLDEDGRWLVTQWRDAREPTEPEPTG